ncbi:DUF3737 family protein [Ruminococcus sp.]|uniref:DUF3737 family protein n=1 Tax=Ruminococcus sp. TaxID=41978 RepID=UPI003452A663
MNTTLAFQYSTVDADIIGNVDSVKNSTSRISKGASCRCGWLIWIFRLPLR